MKTFLLAPDSFKGTLSAAQVCAVQSAVIRRHIPGAVIRAIPMADGGEGMADAYLNIMGGRRITASVSAPLGGRVEAAYGILPDGTAVIEMAAAAGLPLVSGREDPLNATTRGVGELLLHAVSQGCTEILLGLGGSCTNDCGTGMAAALGYCFFDDADRPVEPLAKNLGQIARIAAPDRLPPIHVRAACDVDNPLTGDCGATRTFGPQKGADAPTLALLEQGMCRFAQVLAAFYGEDLSALPGAGAAGGMGAAVPLFLHGALTPGAELLLDSVGFDALLAGADAVFTGEGRIDAQSARGKVPGTLARHCRAANVPCIALCGSIGSGVEEVYACGLTAAFSAIRRPGTMDSIRQTAAADLEALTDSVLRLLAL